MEYIKLIFKNNAYRQHIKYMSETTLMIAGLVMIYSTIHFFSIQANKAYADRTDYEKVVTWVAVISIGLVYLGLMME